MNHYGGGTLLDSYDSKADFFKHKRKEKPMEQTSKNTGIKKCLMCMKHQMDVCEESAHCRDPKIYCKYRNACPIWFMEKRGGKYID